MLDLDGAPARAVRRIKRTSRRMGELLNTLLFLAREESDIASESNELLNVNEIASMWLAQLSNVYSGKGNSVDIQHRDTLLVRAPESVLSIVLGNLLGNAFSYTAYGAIKVFVDSNSIRITDTGVGMEQSSVCLLYTSPSPRDATLSRMPSSA